MTAAKPIMEQIKDEPTQDYVKFLVFLRLGANRSIEQAYKQYYETTKNVTQGWYALAKQYSWTERASEYDKRSK